MADGNEAPHYGRVPNRRHGAIWEIGLKPEARRELMPVEVAACTYVLRAIAQETASDNERKAAA